jgi:drug/metabolite transporter (DMT)-like permease
MSRPAPAIHTDLKAPLTALASAALFGLSIPFAKLLLGNMGPWFLAGLLYLGSGTGLSLWLMLRKTGTVPSNETRIRRRDIPYLAAAILFGGVAGPLLLLSGLRSSSAASASLLLNFESVATLAIAWVVFREHVDFRLFAGAVAIVIGGVLLSWQGPAGAFDAGSTAIVLACVCWGIDNNLTRKISAADPVMIAAAKGLIAGSVNISVAMIVDGRAPSAGTIGLALLLGFLSYGLSLVLFILALRHLGTARTGAYYGTAPFIAAIASVALLGEAVTGTMMAAALLMGMGAWLHISEKHRHEHRHEPFEHDHRHFHDAHHQHEHEPGGSSGEPHSHPHEHGRLVHAHAHWPDIHHRHTH